MSDNIPPRNRSRRNNKKSNKNWLVWLLLFVAFVVAAIAGAFYASSSSLFDKPDKPAAEKRLAATDKTIVMIMGVDQREDDVGRSDTLMVATLDPKKDKAALLSIPRDTRVKIKGHGYDKINSAFAYGGHKLTQSTVENFLGVNMEHYVMVDVHAFQRIIDAIGGVDIDVEKRMYYEDPWDDDGGLVIDLFPGEQHMDGKTAMTYVRYRDEEGDIGRISRQQKFMQAVMDKVTSPSIITKLPAVIKEVFNSVETDMSLRQMLEFASSLKDAQKNGLTTEMVPGDPMYIGGVSYWIPDVAKLRRTVANTLDVTLSSADNEELEKESNEYRNSIPADATTIDIRDYNRIVEREDDRTEVKKKKENSKKDSDNKKDETDSADDKNDNSSSTNKDKDNDYDTPSETTSRHPVSEGTTTVNTSDASRHPESSPAPSAPVPGMSSTGKTQ